ncbi:MAG: FtsW/RodA/SpoVE family cell cycle protein, partial [Acidobacteriota bacterium]|nr:FtsW/RodA/SpoVE family cell cycle protein [Acidobacteriota bacterium]
MFLIALAICGFGIMQIFSATHDTVWQDAWWKQIVYVAAGVILMWIVASIDYHTLLSQVPAMYLLSSGALLAVLLIGKLAFGSKRWILLPGGVHLQVSEFTKLVIILMVARFMTELKSDVLETPDLLKIVGLIGLPMLLVAREPDLGTALTYLPILAVGVFLAGLKWQYWVGIAVVVLCIVPSSYYLLKDYQ